MKSFRTAMAVICLCACLVFVSFSSGQGGTTDQPRSFSLPQHGTLILSVPAAWKESVRQPPENLPPTITLSPAQGDEFKVLITPLWSPRNDATFNKEDNVRTLVQNDLKEMLPGAVEKQVSLQKFKSINGTGYYFLVTDKAPKPGDYPYAVRAGVGVGDLLLSVTVLSRTKDSQGISSTIKALQSAKQANR